MPFILLVVLFAGGIWLRERHPFARREKERAAREREEKRRGIHRRGARVVHSDDLRKMIDKEEETKK